jgi:hypothetical protein
MLRTTTIPLPEVGLIAGTRVLFGVGLGLLLSERLCPEHRRPVAVTLLIVGALTTIPLVVEVLAGLNETPGDLLVKERS